MVEAQATARGVRTSAQKAGLVCDLIRGKSVNQALATLQFTRKTIAREIAKVLRSAVANVQQDEAFSGDIDRLFVSAAYANQGPSMKRVRPAPMGRAYRVVKRTAHLTVQVSERLIGAPLRIGASVCAQMPSERAERWHALLARALAGERLVVEKSISTDGVMRHYLVSLNSIASAGTAGGVTVFVKDITELKRTEAQARQHQAELAHALRLHTMSEMAASLAHEINQPLGAIANYAQGCIRRLRAGTVGQPELLERAEEIAREALRAGEITRRMRELLRKGDTRREPANLNRIIAAALDIIAPTVRQRTAVVRFHESADLPPVDVDDIQIEQVVINLLLNALEAIDVPGRAREIDVRTSSAGDSGVQVAVRDAGIGLDAGAIEQIFEPFFTTKPDGLGMGLAISRSIVEAHGGRLWATPNDAAGATFCFVLPAAAADAG